MTSKQPLCEPIAIVGLACRLPGGNTTPHKLWQFLKEGGIASNKVPKSRFNIEGHWDGSMKPRTMRPPGGMFLEDTDPADFDASFFEISRAEAISMDPNQRQMLEVVYEGLENAGIPLESLDGAPVACFVGSFASDYGDIHTRDPEDRPAAVTVGVGRSIMANRLSHFLNIKGPSMTIDTACSGSLVGFDVASRYLQTGEINAAIIATSNLYLNPEHVMDIGGVIAAHSPSGLCHTFDISADGYVKAEAVSAVIIKRLSDAVRDRDPIRAVILGSSTNSDGRTPGIANPNAEAQAAAIRAAYANAGITDFNATTYLECHGTGTQAGDPTEVKGAASVFGATRSPDQPLIIGSIKSNVGHAEPAAGISGVIKAVLATESGIIPGNPTFENPNPKIDFKGLKVKATRTAIPWPAGAPRRASINSFGYGGSNAHLILEQRELPGGPRHISSYLTDEDEFTLEEDEAERPYSLVVSANDAPTLAANIRALCDHLFNPRVRVALPDLAYTLSQRRTRLWHRAFVTTRSLTDLDEHQFVVGKKGSEAPRVGFVFTGQGAQWPQMGADLLRYFPAQTRAVLAELDAVLQSLPDPPRWSLLAELTEARSPEHLRQPEFSQPLVTALQLVLLDVLAGWGVRPVSVVGHSSGEIAAAYAAGLLDRAGAIKASFYRGRAAIRKQAEARKDVGMLAVGLGHDALAPYLERHAGHVWVACYNSPSSLTVSGVRASLEALAAELKADGHFARLLQVDLAYHSPLMDVIGEEYEALLSQNFTILAGAPGVTMFSSVTGTEKHSSADAAYWKANMVSPVKFSEAAKAMLSADARPNFLIEIGPSGALGGPVSQILKDVAEGTGVVSTAAWARGTSAYKALFDVAGRLFVAGSPIDLARVNLYGGEEGPGDTVAARTIIDLPNYTWNHSVKYWHENAASKDWRFKAYVNHDLLGSKVLGTTWQAPTWRKLLDIADVPWLKDHKMGDDILLPGAGFLTMAVEAIYQKTRALAVDRAAIASPNELAYKFRNVRFDKALVLEEGVETTVTLSLAQVPGSKDWHEFSVATHTGDVFIKHCSGLVRVQDAEDKVASAEERAPLEFPAKSRVWYKSQAAIGYGFGPAFQKVKTIEAFSGQRRSRVLVDLTEPPSKWSPQSYYPIHPASLDGCFQTVTPALWAGEHSAMKDLLVPSLLDELVINKTPKGLQDGLSLASAEYSGRGRLEEAKSYMTHCDVYHPESGALLMQMRGLRFAKLDMVPQPDPHTFARVSWKPDISFLSQADLEGLGAYDNAEAVIDLVAHKYPNLNVLEVSFGEADSSSLWFAGADAFARSAYTQYAFAAPEAKTLVSTQTKWEEKRESSFHLLDLEHETLGLPSEARYELVILRLAGAGPDRLRVFLERLKGRVQKDGQVIVLEQAPDAASTPSRGIRTPDAVETSPGFSVSQSALETPPTIPSTPGLELNDKLARVMSSGAVQKLLKPESLQTAWEANGFRAELDISATDGEPSATLYKVSDEGPSPGGDLQVHAVRLASTTPPLDASLRDALAKAGWSVQEQAGLLAAGALPAGDTVLVLDEAHAPVLTLVNAPQWEALKALVGSGKRVLWLTRGAQFRVTDPNTALAHGLFRVARREDAGARLAVLDLEHKVGAAPAAARAINSVLRADIRAAGDAVVESEYVERGGVLYVHRVVPDGPVNAFKRAEAEGAALVTRALREPGPAVALRSERVGTLESLTWCEVEPAESPIAAGKVEVDVLAVGVNFKDVAVAMGIVPENEHTIGYEGAGVVRRLGPDVTKFRVGDRVCWLNSGSYGNRIQVTVERAHAIPDSMSYEDAATIPSVYLCSIYCLYDIANLKEGQSVLIHSAAGGVGIACLHLARYKKAEIYVTVGTEEKRRFLQTTFGIPPSHMFSSRDTQFAKDIMAATQGRGVDVIINSLTGDLLDASWRIIADGGTMVEIGKRDIVDRNTLSMEPFDRNASFRAMDFSYTQDIRDPLIDRLLGDIFTLVDGGHVKPIQPVTTFSFGAVATALAHLRSGRHIGKVVISDGGKDVQVPVRPALAPLQLRPDAAYLIVGGLKGLCGSLAIHMARAGARHIVAVSRSGAADPASQKVKRNCALYGCDIVDAQGDVSDAKFLARVFAEAPARIAGIIQGAMVLRDKPYETMTVDDYHTALQAKVAGTWALHETSLQLTQPLDFFTLLSSVSGIVGNKGQANYAAGNTFLDAFADYRRAHGLAANSVNLGLIQDVGYVAEQEASFEARFDTRQWTPIREATLRRILGYSIRQQGAAPLHAASAAQLITGIGFPLAADVEDLAREARFRYLFQQTTGEASGGAAGGSQGDETLRAFHTLRKAGADAAALARVSVEALGAQLTKILRLETEIEPAKSLMSFGLDSLAAVELRNWIRVQLGAELTTFDITNASSVNALGDKLIAKLASA